MTVPPNLPPPAPDLTRDEPSGGGWFAAAGRILKNGVGLGLMYPIAGAVKDTAEPIYSGAAHAVSSHPYAAAAAVGAVYTANKVHGCYEQARAADDRLRAEEDRDYFDGEWSDYASDDDQFYEDTERRLEHLARHDRPRFEQERRRYVHYRQQHASRNSDIPDFAHRFRPPSPPPTRWQEVQTRVDHGTRRFFGEDVDSMQEMREGKRMRERAHRDRWDMGDTMQFEFRPGTLRRSNSFE